MPWEGVLCISSSTPLVFTANSLLKLHCRAFNFSGLRRPFFSLFPLRASRSLPNKCALSNGSLKKVKKMKRENKKKSK